MSLSDKLRTHNDMCIQQHYNILPILCMMNGMKMKM